MTPHDVLRDVFGFEGFRPSQEDVVDRVVAGGDAMAPASPTPLVPRGLVVEGVTVRSVVKLGRSAALGMR